MIRIINVIILCFAILYIDSTSSSRLATLQKSKSNYQLPPLSSYSPTVIAIATIGQSALYDDFISIWLTVELQSPHKKEDVPDLDPFISSILELKPLVPSSYYLPCYLMIELEASRKCIKYLDIGKKLFPNDWKMPFLEGYISLFILSEPQKASKYFAEAEKLEKAPKYIKGIRTKLDEKLKYSLEWTDLNSNNYKEMQLFLQADPFFQRLIEIQEKMRNKPL